VECSLLPVLSTSLVGEIHIRDVVERLAKELSLTPEERAKFLPSGKQTTFANRVHWAKTYLSKTGLLDSTRRGYFKITPRWALAVPSPMLAAHLAVAATTELMA